MSFLLIMMTTGETTPWRDDYFFFFIILCLFVSVQCVLIRKKELKLLFWIVETIGDIALRPVYDNNNNNNKKIDLIIFHGIQFVSLSSILLYYHITHSSWHKIWLLVNEKIVITNCNCNYQFNKMRIEIDNGIPIIWITIFFSFARSFVCNIVNKFSTQ